MRTQDEEQRMREFAFGDEAHYYDGPNVTFVSGAVDESRAAFEALAATAAAGLPSVLPDAPDVEHVAPPLDDCGFGAAEDARIAEVLGLPADEAHHPASVDPEHWRKAAASLTPWAC